MFYGFYDALREEGLPVSMNEWLTLMEALSVDLAGNSLTEFYRMARSLLVKSEMLFDKYDAAFVRYFGDQPQPAEKEAPQEIRAAERAYNPDFFNPARYEDRERLSPDSKPDMGGIDGTLEVAVAPPSGGSDIDERRQDATAGEPATGAGVPGESQINLGGETGAMTAVKVAGQRRYRDYQDDNINNTRQYEVALRNLRQLSTRLEGPKDELNLDATIEETGRNNGLLSLEWERPRKNSLKVLVLMDSMGSIYSHYEVCKKLFNAANKSTHFKEIRFFYFHNCIYGHIYKNQWLDIRESIATEDFFRLYNGDYRVLIVGDAQMGEQELTDAGGIIEWSAEYNKEAGLVWLKRIARHYPYAVWLNPVPERLWGGGPDFASISLVGEVFPMFELTPGGIGKAVKRLLQS